MDPEIAVTRIARRQCGLLTLEQAAGAGVGGRAALRRVEAGHWEHPYRGVFAVAGHPWTFERRVMAAVLAAGGGACASHATAAALFGWIPSPRQVSVTIHLTLLRGRRPRLPGVVAHQRRILESRDVIRLGSIPVTSPSRTVIDLAAVLGDDELERVLDAALVDGKTSVERIERDLSRLPRSVPGRGRLRGLLEERTATPRLDSRLEASFLRLFRRLALPVVPHYEVRVGDRRYELDFAIPPMLLAIEIDGPHHNGHRQRRLDRERQNDLEASGWRFQRFVKDDRRRPDHVARQLDRALRSPSQGARPGR